MLSSFLQTETSCASHWAYLFNSCLCWEMEEARCIVATVNCELCYFQNVKHCIWYKYIFIAYPSTFICNYLWLMLIVQVVHVIDLWALTSCRRGLDIMNDLKISCCTNYQSLLHTVAAVTVMPRWWINKEKVAGESTKDRKYREVGNR